MGAVRVRLREIRAARGLSQRQVAARAGLRLDTVSALERGQSKGITFWTLARLSEALGCDPGEIFAVEEDAHQVPVLGGPEEDDLIRQRLSQPGRRVDGPSFVRELLGPRAAATARGG